MARLHKDLVCSIDKKLLICSTILLGSVTVEPLTLYFERPYLMFLRFVVETVIIDYLPLLEQFLSLYWSSKYAITIYFVKCWLTNRLYFLFFSGIQMLNLLVPILVDCLLELPDSANKHSKALHENCLLVLKQIGPQYPLVRNCLIISMLSFCDLTPKNFWLYPFYIRVKKQVMESYKFYSIS